MSGVIVLALRLLAALALYGFLGWALYTLWKETQRQGEANAQRRAPGILLTVRQKNMLSLASHFSQPEIILGRDPGCDLPINDDTVSTRHARLAYHHNQWWLEDLASTNGTILNDIAVQTPTVLATDDVIQCGSVQIHVTLSPDTLFQPTQKLERKA